MSNDNINTDKSQEDWQEYLTRISAPGYQSPIIVPDDEPLSPTEYLPALVDTLCPIANSLDSIDNGIGYLCDIFERLFEAYIERTEAIREYNRLRAEEPPLNPPPTGQHFTKPRIDVSPGAKRLRRIEKGGE